MEPITNANSSGFPLQIKIAHVANENSKWRVTLEEHPWEKNETNQDGFIDIVVNNNNGPEIMVIECKRVRDTSWVFLIPKEDPRKRSHACLWISFKKDKKWEDFYWEDIQAIESHEAKFCAIPGQSNGRKIILDRIAFELIESIEALARQERNIFEKYDHHLISSLYIPVIVTTAELNVAFFNPSTIKLQDGTLPSDTKTITVPYLRYRKSLSSGNNQIPDSRSLRELNINSERTIFIVNSEHFDNFLNKFEITDRRYNK